MKYWFTRFLTFFAFISIAFAGAYLEDFQASTEGENVKLWWKTGEEKNVSHFIIQRSTAQNVFTNIATKLPQGSNSYYSYIDEAAYKTSEIVFTYRLLIVDNDGTVTRSSEVHASPTLSVPTRTWGSIKAMFR
ncbi:MAG: hypothetical protein ACM339_03455 [Ignavibacteria bacterium]|jgi:hypothetical protein